MGRACGRRLVDHRGAGNWTMQGYGSLHYTNVVMPFPDEPPHVPSQNPTGIYRREFTVPDDWQGRRLVLHFGGCEGALFIYVNGEPVGISKDARTPAEFDVSAHVRFGAANKLVAIVIQWSDASFIEDQDHWWQAGLQREVYLYTTGTPHLQDVFARGDLTETPSLRPGAAGPDGCLRVTCKIGFAGELHASCSVEAQLYDEDANPVFTQPLRDEVTSPATYRAEHSIRRTKLYLEEIMPQP